MPITIAGNELSPSVCYSWFTFILVAAVFGKNNKLEKQKPEWSIKLANDTTEASLNDPGLVRSSAGPAPDVCGATRRFYDVM